MSTSPKVTPEDQRYRAVIDKQFNKRFRASPDYIRFVGSTDDIVSAVHDAVSEGRRVVVTSGGHCLENFVSDPDVRAIIDVSPMKRVYFDAKMGAVAVEAGATVGEAFRALFDSWKVVVPFGEYPGIGLGGHVAGGAFGFLCRQLGLTVDYLYAVEVVTVDASGRASVTVATRETNDPNRDLWWAHTGGGAGTFGVVSRFWFRAQGASGSDPASLLPRAPESVTSFKAEWSWSDLDRAAFARLVQNFGRWGERNSDADSPSATLSSLLQLQRTRLGKIIIRGVSTAGAFANEQWEKHLAAVSDGVPTPGGRERVQESWLDFALNPLPELFTMPPGGVSSKGKDALLRRPLDDRQIGVAYDFLTSTAHDVMGGMLGLMTYGGRVNTVAPNATAASQRGSIFDIACTAGWMDPADADKNLAWVRAFYGELFSESGGVPVPGERYEGSLINHPDLDHADPAYNTSGVPWHTLYFKDNYPPLQRIKAQWDPRNVFRHALSVRAE